jgi:L-fuconolactonase
VRACPQCTFILDHIGGPLRSRGHWKDERDATDAQWRADITALAELPNVFMKVGGSGMASMRIPSVEESWPRAAAPPSSQAMLDAVSPFYEHVIQSFGTDRCMFESNFSRGKRMGLTSKEKEAIFAGTAERVYRLGFDRGAGERENSAAL